MPIENRTATSCNLIFIYIGDRLPKYARDSIKLAAVTSGMKITLLGSQVLAKEVPNDVCEFVPIESFYSSDAFHDASGAITSDHTFRDGFWLKSLERFYVLSAYMHHNSINEVLHAELDQLVFRVDILVDNLRASKLHGVFVPLHSEIAAVASIFYCNGISSLDSLLMYAEQGDTFPNEMALIAKWVRGNPEIAHALPTLSSLLNYSLVSVPHLPHSRTGGLVDAAQLGQWVAGIDPKNVPISQRPKNKFVDPQTGWLLHGDQLKEQIFKYSESSHELIVVNSSGEYPLYNLHIHSKIHSQLASLNISISELLNKSNSENLSGFQGTRKVQLQYFFASRLANAIRNPYRIYSKLLRDFNILINRRPSSAPFLSGDTFRNLADHIWEARSRKPISSQIKSGQVIFCESDLFDDCVDNLLSKVSTEYTLILGNSDENHYASFRDKTKLLSASKIFAQNMAQEIPGVIPLPIGLENRWRANHGKVSKFKSEAREANEKTFRIMSTFSIGTNPTIRGQAQKILSQNSLVDSLGMISPNDHRRALDRYAFIACPPGNGLDTHRTWEAMYRGSVPIVLDSYMNHFFKSLGLPILIVSSYEELAQLNENRLKEIYLDLKLGFLSEALWFPFWKSRILN